MPQLFQIPDLPHHNEYCRTQKIIERIKMPKTKTHGDENTDGGEIA